MMSRTKTLNCDILSLDNDTEMVGHYMNPKFVGASLDYSYSSIREREYFCYIYSYYIWKCYTVTIHIKNLTKIFFISSLMITKKLMIQYSGF